MREGLTLGGRRIWWIVGALVAALLVYAWVDGGERPIETIVVPVDLPENAR